MALQFCDLQAFIPTTRGNIVKYIQNSNNRQKQGFGGRYYCKLAIKLKTILTPYFYLKYTVFKKHSVPSNPIKLHDRLISTFFFQVF